MEVTDVLANRHRHREKVKGRECHARHHSSTNQSKLLTHSKSKMFHCLSQDNPETRQLETTTTKLGKKQGKLTFLPSFASTACDSWALVISPKARLLPTACAWPPFWSAGAFCDGFDVPWPTPGKMLRIRPSIIVNYSCFTVFCLWLLLAFLLCRQRNALSPIFFIFNGYSVKTRKNDN